MKIFLLYGGKSAEHDVSIMSAFSMIKEIYYKYYQVIPIYITRTGKWLEGDVITKADQVKEKEELRLPENSPTFDLQRMQSEDSIAFPILHGPNGEDGTVQGLFEVLDIPYVGAGVLASATGMDKLVSKALFEHAGLPQLPYRGVNITDWKVVPEEEINELESKLTYPMFVKPCNLGSSVGISRVTNAEELTKAINLAFEYDYRVVVEQGVKAREIEVAVLGNEDIHTSYPGELLKGQEFYDYEQKYVKNEVELQIPAQLENDVSKKVREYAAKAFLTIDGSGLTRADFFVTEDNEVFINEVNTFPGFTPFSMYPLLWENTGLSYGDLIEELIQLGLKRHQLKNKRAIKD